MKNILLILTIILFSFSVKAQSKTDTLAIQVQKAGQHFSIASDKYIKGYMFQAVGTALIVIAPLTYNKENTEAIQPSYIFYGLGGAAFIIGIVQQVNAWLEIEKAGNILQNKKDISLNFGIQNNGIGLSFKF